MTRRDVEQIVRTWQDRLALNHWRVTVDFDDELDPDKALAEVEPHDVYDYAKIKLSRGWRGWDREFANLTLVHELMHLHTRDLQRAGESIEPLIGGQARKLWRSRFDDETEKVVDKLAGLAVALGGVA